MKPMLVGGLLDQTSSTLTQPDMDFSMQWGLGEDLADCLYIRPTDRGESGQYTLQVPLYYLLSFPCPDYAYPRSSLNMLIVSNPCLTR